MKDIGRYKQYLTWLDTQHVKMCELLQRWAEVNSWSRNLPGLAKMLSELETEVRVLGGDQKGSISLLKTSPSLMELWCPNSLVRHCESGNDSALRSGSSWAVIWIPCIRRLILFNTRFEAMPAP